MEPKEQPKVFYIVHPGWVKSQNDDDNHFIGFGQLCRLYHVNPRDCIDASNEHWAAGRDVEKFEHLYPRSRGDYP